MSDGQRLTDRKRRAVLEAGTAQFQRDGFDGASMNRIAAAAGVSKRTVYNHFASKEELFTAIVSDLLQKAGKSQDVPYDPDAPLEEQLAKIGRQQVAMMMSDDFIQLVRVVVSRFLVSPELAAKTLGENESGKAGLIRWIKAAKRDGRLSVGDPFHAARQFSGIIQEFAFWPQVLRTQNVMSKQQLNRVVTTASRMFLAYYEV